MDDPLSQRHIQIEMEPSRYRGHRRQPSDAPSYHSSNADSNEEAQMQEEWENKRQELLKDLPSRQLDQMLDDDSRPNLNRRKSSGKTLRRRKSHHPGSGYHGHDSVDAEIQRELEQEQEMIEDQDVADFRVAQQLRETTSTTLARKKRILVDLHRSSNRRRRNQKTIGCWKRFKYRTALAFGRFKRRLAEVRYSLGFWRGHLKTIEGHFGTGVLSYFQFLKWLFKINFGVFIIIIGFIVIPQLMFRVYKDDGYERNNVTFTGYTELLTGGGWFEQTEMYYGYYTHTVIETVPGLMYSMPYAYLLTCGGYYLLILIIMAVSASSSYRKNYIEGSDEFDNYASKVFCGWDFGITSLDAASLKKKSIFKELRELLAGWNADLKVSTCGELISLFLLRVVTNLFILAMLGGSGYLIWYISITQSLKTDIMFLGELAMPLCVNGINLLLPFAFTVIAQIEKFKQPKTELLLTMIRTIVLNFVTVGVLIYFWFNDVDCSKNQELDDQTQKSKDKKCVECWETFMGKQIYMLAIVDFVFVLLFTLISEFFRRLLTCCITALGHPEFNIGRNTLNLIYSQAICWLGSFYSPFLPLIQLIKLLVIFYVKRVSVMQNCVPPSKPWRASIASTLFLILLFLSFLFSSFSIGYSIWKITPSTTCGPYRGLNSSYEIVFNLINEQESENKWLADGLTFLSSPGAIAVFLTILSVLVYYTRIVSIGRKEGVVLLKRQLALEGKDKQFLLKMLQDASQGERTRKATQANNRLKEEDCPPSPGGKQFAKHVQNRQGEISHKPGTPMGGKNIAHKESPGQARHSDGAKRQDVPGVPPSQWESPADGAERQRPREGAVRQREYRDRDRQSSPADGAERQRPREGAVRQREYRDQDRQSHDPRGGQQRSDPKEHWTPGSNTNLDRL